MPSARAVFLFSPSGYNVHTSFRPYNAATRFLKAQTLNYTADNKKPVERVLQAFIVYTAICKYSMRPRKRYRRASASFRRLFIRLSGRGCSPAVSAAVAIVQAVRPFDLLRLVSRSGGRVRRYAVSGSGGGARPARVVSSPSLLSAPFYPLLSACSRVVSRKVVKSKVVRES